MIRSLPNRRGATRADVIVGLLLCALLSAGAIAAEGAAAERARRVKCASNLRMIGQAILIYANENKGAFPRTLFDTNDATISLSNAGRDEDVSFPPLGGTTGVPANNTPGSFFLVLKGGDITSEVFICPSSQGERGYQGVDINGVGGNAGYSNWPTGDTGSSFATNLSYSYTCPFPLGSARALGYKLNYTLSSDFAIASDMSPGKSGGTSPNADNVEVASNASRQLIVNANSNNHAGDGQNVLYADGHVDWNQTPYCGSPRPTTGTPRDNIYTGGIVTSTAAGTLNTRPADQYDSVMMPTDDAAGG
jgi:prepilin-type processing-associated H-X9-DG protein